MKYIQTLGLNQFLNPDSLKEIRIGKIKLGIHEISKAEPEELLGILKVISKSVDYIDNSDDLINLIISTSYDNLLYLINYNKKVDLYLEKIISYSIDESIKYIKFINKHKINTGFKIDEKQIIENDNSKLTLEYVTKIKKKSFPEAEHIILKNIDNAIEYCVSYKKEPWKQLEEKIEELEDRTYYFKYMHQVLKFYYEKNFPGKNVRSLIQENYPSYEENLMNSLSYDSDIYPISGYAMGVIGGRWLEFEEMVEDKINDRENFYSDECNDFFYYMLKFYPGRWRIAEPYFINLKEGYPKLKDLDNYIREKVITEYQKNINTFEDLEKYEDDFNMWDKLLQNREIIFIFNPLYTLIKLRNLVNYYDKKIVQNLFKRYFPLNYKNHIESII